ncbi:MAG TPA: fatty acid desaturase [Lichenihabitans sp.]|jgi:omega-6 fatty acid desaturase (delta-12 desaturase)|nr:fatty acid desaturase [Lichenihabitans sp.]
MAPPSHNHAPPSAIAEDWMRKLRKYCRPSTERSIIELMVTLLPFVAAWIVMVVAINLGHIWLSGLLLLPTSGLVVRLFMIQHDCGHGAFFPGRAANDWTGRVLGILTLTPYDYWRRTHAVHHATTGDLDSRGIGDVTTLTLREYLAGSFWRRLRYRLYRNPAIMFGIGPIYLFLFQYRLPFGLMRKRQFWVSTMATNLTIAATSSIMIWLCGFWPFILVHVPLVIVAASAGVWLFYVQHQFEETQWSSADSWNAHDAGLYGSSHYDLPGILRWFTANIGVHHVHHLVSRIPFYRLPEVLRDYPELRDIGRLRLWQSFGCVRLVLWDEARQRLISFRDLKVARQSPCG